MPDARLMRALLAELARFGGAAAANTAFGYGSYAGLVWLGLPPVAAQALATVLGVMFNLRTYAVAFRAPADRGRFVATYAASYGVGLLLLLLFTRLVRDPYLAGLLALGGTAAFNFTVLRGWVFRRRRPASAA